MRLSCVTRQVKPAGEGGFHRRVFTWYRAIRNFALYTESNLEEAKIALEQIVKMANLNLKYCEAAIRNMEKNAQVVLHFHPDRTLETGVSTIESMFASNRYEDQYETNISNGGLSGFVPATNSVKGMG